MSLVLDSTLKVSLVVLAGLLCAGLLRRRSAAFRHWVLAATVVCASATPFLEWTLPAWRVPVGIAAPAGVSPSNTASPPQLNVTDSVSFTPSPEPTNAQLQVDRTSLVSTIWLAGTVASLGVLIIGLFRLRWLAARATRMDGGPWVSIAAEIQREYGLPRPVRLLRTEHPSLLVTWGVVSPKVLIPASAASWSDDRIRVVLRHELAHIRRGDWIAQLAGEVLRSAYWFNPILWIACTRLRAESEQACDDEVLAGGVQASDYAAHLLEVAKALRLSSAPRLPAPAIARSTTLERRFDAMLNTQLIRTPTTRSFRFATGAALFAATTIVAAAQSGPSTFSGSVVDPTGAPVAGVAVVLTNKATSAKFEVRTDDRGQFQFVPLPADSYALEASLPGFKKVEDTVALAGKASRRDLTLALGTLQETITITGGPSSAEVSADAAPFRAQPAALPRDAFQRDLAACTPSSTGGHVRPPRKIRDVRPIYPQNLQLSGVGGTVVLNATVGTDGAVKDVQVLKSAHPDLDLAATEAVKQWQFDGTLLNCTPSEVTMTVSLNFNVK